MATEGVGEESCARDGSSGPRGVRKDEEERKVCYGLKTRELR